MSKRRLRRLGVVAVLLALAAAALGGAVLRDAGSGGALPAADTEELSPALAKKIAAMQQFAPPGSFQEGDRGAADEWMQHAIPGTEIPAASLAASREAWRGMSRRGGRGANWSPLGPDHAQGLPNPFRDRSVYNSGTPDFSGRIAHVAIDPDCGSGRGGESRRGHCRLWIANAAGGGVWRTDNALAREPDWKYLSIEFEHNSTASIELDPNDPRSNTLWVGTGEPNACGSGCEAGVGVYKSTDGGDSWSGPFGFDAFYNRAVGSMEVRPGDSSTIFAASGRAIRGLTSNCCGGADALIPGAPHFGLWRSKNGGQTWELVNQGANVLCTGVHPDVVSLNGTDCSPRGARRVMLDPVDPNTVYASFFARGIWRSRSNGDVGTWEQIMPRLGPANLTTERAEFDVVRLPNGETRMYVAVGGGGVFARFRRNDNVRSAPAATVLASWIDLTSAAEDTPGYSSFGYCDPQCVYDNYVYAPAHHFPDSGADADTVYISGDNAYSENNWGPNSPRFAPEGPNCGGDSPSNTPPCGRSNARAVLLSTNAGVHFTDMTEDTTDNFYPGALHPDHHALVVNPRNWRQFFDVGDGGIVRSNGRFADDSGDCVQPKGYVGTRLAFCQLMLSRVPERLETMNEGLRTLHFYEIAVSPFDKHTVIGGTQDNGSWERGSIQGAGTNGSGIPQGANCQRSAGNSTEVWVNTNIADGGHNNFDIGDPCFRMTGFQVGQMMVAYEPKNQLDMNWIADTQFVFYGSELNAFIGVANGDPVREHWLWSAREHVFRSMNQGRNPILTKETHREHCNIWFGDGDVDDNGVFEPPKDICDDWKPLGDPTPRGRLTYGPAAACPNPTPPPNFVPCPPPFPYGTDRSGGYTAVVERANDGRTLWAATQPGRVFVSKNADDPNPAAVVFDRIDDDPTATNDPPRFPSAIYVDPTDPNHAWIAYSGFNTKTPGLPGHVFEVRYVPGASTFTLLDGNEPVDRLGDIPATSIAVSDKGTIYVGTDYGCVASKGDGVWRPCGSGLPSMPVSDLVYVREYKTLYAGTHGQGVWALKVHGWEGG